MKTITTDWIASILGTTATANVEITSVAIDTRKVAPGCLFVCIQGERFDGNDFAGQALSAGAAAVLCAYHADCNGPCIRVADTRAAFLQLAAAYRNLFQIPVIALTGSVGKTTTKEMTHCVLSGKYNTLKTPGNFNNEIGLPQTLFRLEEDTQAAVIEMGMSHAGEISVLSKATRPTAGIITNIGVSHIENLGSRAGIFRAKMELLEGMQPGAPLIVNGDDAFLSTVQSDHSHKVYTYGIEKGDFKGYNIKEIGFQTQFTVSYFGQEQTVLLPAIGMHNVYDALAAFAAGYLLGVDSETAAAMLQNYMPDGMRQKCVEINGMISIEDCYNAAPDSMRASISTLMGIKAQRKIAVLADMLELGAFAPDAHREVGELLGKAGVDILLAYGNHAKKYALGAKEFGFTDCYCFDTKEALCELLCRLAAPGDAILFKGSRGMKLEDVIHVFYEKRGNKNE